MAGFDQERQTVTQQHNAEHIHIGITFEQYKFHLEEKEKEIRDLLINRALSEREQEELRHRLSAIEQKLIDQETSYSEYISHLEEQVSRLKAFENNAPNQLITDAKQALINGDTEKADLIFTQIEEQADPHILAAAEAAFQRGSLAENDLEYYAAEKHYLRATQLAPDNLIYLNSEANILYTLGRYEEAMGLYQHALVSDLKTYGEDHPEVATRRNNLAAVYHSLGLYEEAEGLYQQALASGIKTYGDDHPRIAATRNNLAGVYRALGRYEEAEGLYQQALASDLKTYGDDHPEVATDRNNLAGVYESLGRYEEAEGLYQQALASGLKTYGDDHPKVATRRSNLAVVYRALGRYEEAEGLYQQALASDLKTYGDDHPKVATRRSNLAINYYDQGQYQKSEEQMLLALKIREKVLGKEHPDTKTALRNLIAIQDKLSLTKR